MPAASAYNKVAQELYVSYFGRPADTNGLLAMTAALAAAAAPTDTAGLNAAYASNAAVRTLIDAFGSSAESALLYGAAAPGFGTDSFVSQIYNNLFGRTPDVVGLVFWINAIDAGSLTRAAAAHAILTGALAANANDAALVNQKVAFANMFTASLDTPHEIDVYQGNMAAQYAREMLARVTASSDPSTFQATIDSGLAQLDTAFKLTAGADKLEGDARANLFLADLVGNGNTLQAGDSVAGGDGIDTLRAFLRPSADSQLAMPATVSVEQIRVHAAGTTDAAGLTVLDGARMNGVTRWENDHSHGDLTIRNVDINAAQLPEDVTIAMVGSTAGDADFSVYFNPHALRAGMPAAAPATLRLQLMDTAASEAGGPPLKESPYDGFRFLLNKMPVQIRSAAIDQAQTYEALLSAIRAEVAATPALEKLVVSLGEPFQAYDTGTGQLLSGREIVIANTGPGILGVAPGAGWLMPGAGEKGTLVPGLSSGAVPLITGTIELDNVGRGASSGDLIVGGTPYLSTRVRSGFEAFNISVERSSSLQSIDSTDNMLQIVTLSNGTIKGDLAVRGAPGAPYGFHDVRLVDARAMSGAVDLTAVITSASAKKYLATPGTQTGSVTGTIDFQYTGGNNRDIISVDIDAAIASSRAIRLAGQEDFRFDVQGGAGHDQLNVRILPPAVGLEGWAIDQDRNNNVRIGGGEGDDAIRKSGTGDAIIDAGAGDDYVVLFDASPGSVDTASDNLILPGPGVDLVMLDTVEGATPAQSSNHTLIVGRDFGLDRIVGFDFTGPGIDHVDLSALGGEILSNSLTVDKSITFAEVTDATSTAAGIGALFNADNAVAQTHVYAAVSWDRHSADFYSIVDPAGPGNAVATREGQILFRDSDLLLEVTAGVFVNAGSPGYNQAEGASSAVPTLLMGVAQDAGAFGIH
ncbi:DUF4214 domain-containing protein [Massilia atriviolacea]|uniref:DUF4214 domain-containing protein n=1 Tax=Massilia atriviolacea TaxID=2495579 RepID=A0A430HTY5_9BURK|nr:DUF4214 domain-containing protein [Massilia atriviolacea]RSZ60932.1 DUF4214 domain-containing protein [Massilia atriviolacea]